MELANEKTNEEFLHLFKKVGSNFQILNRTFLFEPHGAWKILFELGSGGNLPKSSALRADPIFASEPDFVFWRATRVKYP